MSPARSQELQPSFRVAEANETRIILKSRRAPGSLRCCGPLAVAMAMIAGFVLFFIMEGNATAGWGSRYGCVPLGVGILGLALTALNLVELIHLEEVVFDRTRRSVSRSEHLVPLILKLPRWSVAFAEVEAVRFAPAGEGPVWTVALFTRNGQFFGIDRASDWNRMQNLASHLAAFLEVSLREE